VRRKQDRSQNLSERFWGNKNLLLQSGIKPRFLGHPVRSLVSMPTGLHWLLMTTKYYSKIWGPLLIVRVLPGNTFIPNVILAKFAIDFTKHCLLCLSRLSLRLSVNLLRVPEMVGVFSENYRKILLICDDTFFFLKSDKR